jgi:hypothetical protein
MTPKKHDATELVAAQGAPLFGSRVRLDLQMMGRPQLNDRLRAAII